MESLFRADFAVLDFWQNSKWSLGDSLTLTRPGSSNRILQVCSYLFGCFVVFLGASGAHAQQTPAQNPSAQPFPSAAQPLPPSPSNNNPHGTDVNPADAASYLKLGPGDLIELSVYNVPELAIKARIGNSGDVYLPLIDYVHVGDLTVDEAQALIEKRLADGGFVRNPHVTLFVDESASQGVIMLGEVSKPGIYPDLGDHHLYELISEAGGFSQAASRKISIFHRNQTQATQIVLPRNLADDLNDNVEVLPGDTILVPRAPIVYVVGDVGHPSGLLVDNGTLTVLQALALAGGANHTAKLGGVRIIRKGTAGMTETKVPLKKMLEAKTPDITLEADDILFVPLSGGRVLAGQALQAAISAATAVSVYTVHP